LQFLLNDKLVVEENLAPDLTVLDYLRDHCELTGTKEGCASGDCGACTAVLVSIQDDRLIYRSLNTCITFVENLHGKQLVTVEYLACEDKLHPVQQAMVDCHGSQCGFCTPGFVMSLYALWQNKKSVSTDPSPRKVINEYLGGNLCRCTGYQPIINAARLALQSPVADDAEDVRHNPDNPETIRLLKSIAPAPQNDGFYRPSTIAEVCELRARLPAARLLAGGTDLTLEITQGLHKFTDIISLDSVRELSYCHGVGDEWRIGAGLSLMDFQGFFGPLSKDLDALMHRFGSMQVRNQGTVGGNIANASPVGDLAPVFIALNATLVLQSSGKERTVALQDFFGSYKKTLLGVNEIVREIRLPKSVFSGDQSAEQSIIKIYKISKRMDDDISAVLAAFWLQMNNGIITDTRIAFGGMAAIPQRATAIESALRGQKLNAGTLLKAQQAVEQDFQPIDDARASADYRLQVSRNLLQRLYIEITQPLVATRVGDDVHS